MKRTSLSQDELAREVARDSTLRLRLGPVEYNRPWTIDGKPAIRAAVMDLLADYTQHLDDSGRLRPRDTSRIRMRLRTRHPDAYRLLRTVAYWMLEARDGYAVAGVEPARCPTCGQEQPQG